MLFSNAPVISKTGVGPDSAGAVGEAGEAADDEAWAVWADENASRCISINIPILTPMATRRSGTTTYRVIRLRGFLGAARPAAFDWRGSGILG
jgi:hypothetical protein